MLIALQICRPVVAQGLEARVCGVPAREMVFGEHGEVGSLGGGGADQRGGFVEIVVGVHGLEEGGD